MSFITISLIKMKMSFSIVVPQANISARAMLGRVKEWITIK